MNTLTPDQQGTAAPGVPAPISALLLDDSAFDRRRIQRMTDGLGLDIAFDSVPSISALSQMLERQSFDLIMLDFRLPEGDGFEALEVVRANALNRDAATVMITADARTDVAVAAVKGGCMDFIAKSSMDGELLRQVMLSALDHNQHRRGALRETVSLPEQLVRAFSDELTRGTLRSEMSAALQEAARAMIRANAGLELSVDEADVLGFWDATEFQFRN